MSRRHFEYPRILQILPNACSGSDSASQRTGCPHATVTSEIQDRYDPDLGAMMLLLWAHPPGITAKLKGSCTKPTHSPVSAQSEGPTDVCRHFAALSLRRQYGGRARYENPALSSGMRSILLGAA